MARIRTIKPEFWTDEKLSECSVSARLLFVGLISFSDDEGRMEYHPARIRMQIFPCGTVPVKRLTEWLGELSERSLIHIYAVEGKQYLCVPGFRKHQKINRPTPSKFPGVRSEDSVSSPAGLEGNGTGSIPAADAAKRGSRFADFWAAYPKKVKRKDALRLWKTKALDHLADELIDDVKRRQSEDRKWLDGYVPEPPTYLNGERWNDAIEPVRKNGKGGSPAESAEKHRAQIVDLAKMLNIEQGSDDWAKFEARVNAANERRLKGIGR